MKNRNIIQVVAAVLALGMILSLAACGEEEVDVDRIVEEATDEVAESETEIDGCELLTQEDATGLFGEEATRGDADSLGVYGECDWIWESGEDLQKVQMTIFEGEEYYNKTPGYEDLDIGDEGYMNVSEGAQVIDIGWRQDGKTVVLNYINVGDGMPEVTALADDMEVLAKKISGGL